MYNFLNIRVPSSSSDLLESSFDLESAVHFLLHFCFHERRPKALGKEVLAHLTFVSVTVLSSGSFCNLLLVLNSNGTSADGLSLVGNTFFKRVVPFLTLSVIQSDLLNLITHLFVILSFLLLSATVLLSLFFHDANLTLKAV